MRSSPAEDYASLSSPRAREVLEEHYDIGAGLYKMWGSPLSVLRAILLGWERSGHPAQLHYGWDLQHAASLDTAICETTRRAVALLRLDGMPGATVFEPGCGIGGATMVAASELPQAKVIGMSLIASQVDTARSRSAAAQTSNVSFEVGNFLSTAFADESVDGIFAIEALCYTPEVERPALFAELRRILRPGGRLVVLDGVRLREAQSEAERRCVDDVLRGWTFPPPCTPDEFRSNATHAGLEVLQQQDVTCHVYASARRIDRIARWALMPLSVLARVPGFSAPLRSLGFGSAAHARRFIAACVSQRRVFDLGLGAYYLHVLRR